MNDNKFDKNKNKVVIVHYGNVVMYPPVINAIRYLIDNSYSVVLISGNLNGLPENIKRSLCFKAVDVSVIGGRNIISRIQRRFVIGLKYKKHVVEIMNSGDILWTTTDLTVRILNRIVLKYKHVMQMMEMVEWMPLYDGAKLLRFDLKKYANFAWKTVVPEINRAYITKAKWNMKNLPYILPNKPYSLECDNCSEKMAKALESIKQETRKIVLYLGIIGFDRDLSKFAEAIEGLGDEYCFYIIGSVGDRVKVQFNNFLKKYAKVKYLGYFPAPQHLLFLNYTYIGLLPYTTSFQVGNANPLNALYCAPNKIFEYAGFGVPMIGSDLMGLKIPFERYEIGVCCNNDVVKEIERAIIFVDENHEKMSLNCQKYYDSVDLGAIIDNIINE